MGLASLYKSLGAFVGVNLADVLADGPGESGFSCFIATLDSNGNGEFSQSALRGCVSEDSEQENKKNTCQTPATITYKHQPHLYVN